MSTNDLLDAREAAQKLLLAAMNSASIDHRLVAFGLDAIEHRRVPTLAGLHSDLYIECFGVLQRSGLRPSDLLKPHQISAYRSFHALD